MCNMRRNPETYCKLYKYTKHYIDDINNDYGYAYGVICIQESVDTVDKGPFMGELLCINSAMHVSRSVQLRNIADSEMSAHKQKYVLH